MIYNIVKQRIAGELSMKRFKMIYYNLLGHVYIPDNIKNTDEKKLLHISDTPINFFYALKHLIIELSPAIIIHTGDLVDNIKLGIYKGFAPKYDYHVKSIINILESSSAEYIYICVGNHDNSDIIKKYSKKSIIIDNTKIIDVFDTHATLSHYPYEIIKNPSNYNFFGHDISLGNDIINGKAYLNGVSSINILTEKTKKLFYLPYPYGVNDSRLMKGKIGL